MTHEQLLTMLQALVASGRKVTLTIGEAGFCAVVHARQEGKYVPVYAVCEKDMILALQNVVTHEEVQA